MRELNKKIMRNPRVQELNAEGKETAEQIQNSIRLRLCRIGDSNYEREGKEIKPG
jgi:hypothetical protein